LDAFSQALNSLIVFLANIMAYTDPPSIMGWYQYDT
jgi:hypothetical protein